MRELTLDELLELANSVSACRVRQFEWPQEVGCLTEVRAAGEDLVDNVLHADDAELAKVGFDDRVVGQGDALFVDFPVGALVDQVADGAKANLTVAVYRVRWVSDESPK